MLGPRKDMHATPSKAQGMSERSEKKTPELDRGKETMKPSSRPDMSLRPQAHCCYSYLPKTGMKKRHGAGGLVEAQLGVCRWGTARK